MRRRISRLALRIAAIAAALLCAVLLIEWPRSFYQSDTFSVAPVTIVVHRGSLYFLPSIEQLGLETRAVTNAPAWPLMIIPVPLRTWHDETLLGFNGWIEGGIFLLQCPVWFALPALGLLAALCYRKQTEITASTHYLACPTCGHLLVGVVHWRCPECGEPTQSRLVEALPARAINRPADRRGSRLAGDASPPRAPDLPTADIRL